MYLFFISFRTLQCLIRWDRKGTPPAIKIDVKVRQGRKACTLITGLETWKIDPIALADELRVKCASSTSGMYMSSFFKLCFTMLTVAAVDVIVSDLPGKNAGKEVLVQGKQTKIVLEVLEGKGVMKKWIRSTD